jgi:hypothetical protein
MIGTGVRRWSRAPHSTRWTQAAIELFRAQVSEARRIPLLTIITEDWHVFDNIVVKEQQIGLRS